MNRVLAKFIYKYPINDITELNALYYAAAVVLAGVKDPKPIKTKHPFEPDKFIDKEIKRIRRWIGRITEIKQGSKLTPKVKSFLKSITADVSLHHLKMKLAVLCKNKRTRVDN